MQVFSIPMVTRFRGITVREGIVFEGPAGWTEFSPFLDYDDAESAPWLAAAIASGENAWPVARRDSIPVNCTVPAVGPEASTAVVLGSNGCRTAKVKVADPGQSLADDIARVEAVRAALGPGGKVRIDVNGLWSVDEAIANIAVLDRAAGGLEYVEQPCRTVEELAAVRRKVDVPIAADESIRHAADPMRVVRLEGADIAVLKVQPLGGVEACLRIAAEIGIPVVVSSALETSIGLAAGLALAAALPDLPHACGLATTSLLTADVIAEPLTPVDGALPVGRTTVDPARLAAVAADDATTERWTARFDSIRKDHGL